MLRSAMRWIRSLRLAQVLTLALMWPTLIVAVPFFWGFAALWWHGGPPPWQLAFHVQVFWSGWLLLISPPVVLISAWWLARRRA
jgi:hypothetical protein